MSLDTKSAANLAQLVRFYYGDGPTFHRYAAWTENLTYDGDVYEAVPGIEISLGKQHGGTEDVPAKIKMPLVEPVSLMKTAFPEVFVEIFELEPGDDASIRMLWYGSITRTIRNLNGRPNLCEVTVSGIKQAMNARLSVIISQSCWATFGGEPCRKNLNDIRETGSITAIDGQKITVSGLSTLNTDPYWRKGTVKYDGLELDIHKHEVGTGVFYLTHRPPVYWQGKTVVCTPGCDKSIDMCRFWGQESRFTGIGIKMPDRHPLYEEGDG